MHVLALKYGLKTNCRFPDSEYLKEWAHFYNCNKTKIKC